MKRRSFHHEAIQHVPRKRFAGNRPNDLRYLNGPHHLVYLVAVQNSVRAIMDFVFFTVLGMMGLLMLAFVFADMIPK
jgi:hypothetical protein